MERSKAIDILRAGAIFLVCFGRHLMPLASSASSLPRAFFAEITTMLQCGGWVGVDLFFVLSGFLVSGLLFREHQKFGSLSGMRFLFRRALKIYPSFWLLVLFGVIQAEIVQKHFPVKQTISELFFIQNYSSYFLWRHTWSLAVEEHFYLLLLFFLVFLARWGGRENPFRLVPVSFALVALLSLAIRLATNRGQSFDVRTQFFASHLRMDALFFGVSISYFYHFYNRRFLLLARRWRWVLAALGVAALLPAFLFELEQTPFIYTYGLTLFYLGGGALLTASLGITIPDNIVVRAFSYIGVHSYSIYLWHAVVSLELVPYIRHAVGVHWNWPLYVLVYVPGALGLGIGMSLLVEVPALRLRDRWFPPRVSPMGIGR